MKKSEIDTIGIWIANLWDSMETYRTDMQDTNSYSKDGLWVRWRMFRNKGRMQIIHQRKLHFPSVPYVQKTYVSKTLMLHTGYINSSCRNGKRIFYEKENDSYVALYYQQETGKEKLRDINEIEL